MNYPSILIGFKICLSLDYKLLYCEIFVSYRMAALKLVGVLGIILAVYNLNIGSLAITEQFCILRMMIN